MPLTILATGLYGKTFSDVLRKIADKKTEVRLCYLCFVKLGDNVGKVDVLIVISSYPADLKEAWQNFNRQTKIQIS